MLKSKFIFLVVVLSTSVALASVESSLLGLKSILMGSILPIFAVMALGFSAFSFFSGNPNSKTHFIYALCGAAIIFASQSIVDLISRVVN